MLTYSGALLAVDDISVSRAFYEGLLGQKVKFDFGVDVAFEGGLTMHLASHFQGLLGSSTDYPLVKSANNCELFFEEDDIEQLQQRLKAAGVRFIHGIREQPWAQRVLRVYDPDGFIIEIGERMEAAVRRLHEQGFSVEEICKKTGMPGEFVEEALQ
jgi:catechol 2,3-dioxygenase-like lactoylglutathione lyase family enzyme